MSPVPLPERVDPSHVDDERPMLEAWLEFHRATLLTKCAGLDDDQLRRRAVEPSSLTLLGLLRHMADVERGWFRRVVGGEDVPPIFYSDANEDGDFDDVDGADVASDVATYHREVEACRAAAARHPCLDEVRSRRGTEYSVRWVYVHMIEEYARHNGHADLLRERIDGATGE